MSREIKFRAWFRPTQKYKTWIANRYGNEPAGLELNYYTTEDFLDDTWVNTDDYEEPIVFEQYTGLKDKNGKEIYEGDIIIETIDYGSNKVVQMYETYWDEDMLNFGIRGIKGFNYNLRDELWETNASREVIGNIHENPELLEEEK